MVGGCVFGFPPLADSLISLFDVFHEKKAFKRTSFIRKHHNSTNKKHVCYAGLRKKHISLSFIKIVPVGGVTSHTASSNLAPPTTKRKTKNLIGC